MAREVRFSIVDRLGTDITGTKDLGQALEAANLNWLAKEAPVNFTDDFGNVKESPQHRIFYRSDNQEFLGLVGNKYSVLQNEEAFAMAEALLGEMHFVKGGLFGAQTSVTLKAADTKVEDDTVNNYITIRNSFDGTSKVQFCWIPVRKVCENGLLVQIPNAERVFEIPHVGNISRKYEKIFVENVINDGTEAVKRYAASLMKIRCSEHALTKVLDQFYPVSIESESSTGEVSTRTSNKNLIIRQQIAEAFNQDDLANYNGTAYKIFQAFCDFETHSAEIISKRPELAARQQFLRVFQGFSITQKVLNFIHTANI